MTRIRTEYHKERVRSPNYDPDDFDKLNMTHEQKWALEKEASAIFERVVKFKSVSFSEALATVYLTGVLDAICFTNRQNQPENESQIS